MSKPVLLGWAVFNAALAAACAVYGLYVFAAIDSGLAAYYGYRFYEASK